MAEELGNSASMRPSAITADRPLLLLLTGAAGAGKTTFYESKLRESFPILLKSSPSPLEQAEVERKRKELLNSRKSFVFQSSVVDIGLLKEAKSNDFEVKVIFIGTEHSDLNIARILSRASRGGSFAPVAAVNEDYESGLSHLKMLARTADELVLLDNTAEGRGPRVIAQYLDGQIVRLARSVPDWAERVFVREFGKWLDQNRGRQARRELTR